MNFHRKTSTTQEVLFTDNSGSLRLVLWNQDTSKIKSGQCYKISNVVIREFNGETIITLMKNSKISEADRLKI